MRLFSVRNACVAAVALLALAGCDNGPDTINTPTLPSPTVTETFEGTLTPNGAVTHPYAATASGTTTLTATTLTPSDARIGLALGTWNGVACQLVVTNDNATQATTVTGSVGSAGNLCARIYDATGTLAGTVTYTLTVVHP